jgi:hypothetical protein
MSVRSSILADMEAVLKGISGVGDVYTGKYEQVDLDQLTLPALFVLQGSDQEAARSTGYEVFTWRVVVEAWCKDTDAETVFASIHTALSADPTRGGTSMNCRRTGSDILSLDPGRGLIALQQTYEILYRHPIGSP